MEIVGAFLVDMNGRDQDLQHHRTLIIPMYQKKNYTILFSNSKTIESIQLHEIPILGTWVLSATWWGLFHPNQTFQSKATVILLNPSGFYLGHSCIHNQIDWQKSNQNTLQRNYYSISRYNTCPFYISKKQKNKTKQKTKKLWNK